MPGFLTRDDYARTLGSRQDEGGATITPSVDEATWNSWSDEEKWNNLGQQVIITPDDPRYADLAQQTGARNGEHIRILNSAGRDPADVMSGPDIMFADPRRAVQVGNGGIAYVESNLTPEARSHEGDNVNSDFEHAVRNMVTAGALVVGAGTSGILGPDPAAGATATAATAPTGTPDYTPFEANYPGNAPITATPTPTPEPGPGWTAEGGAPPAPTPIPTPAPVPATPATAAPAPANGGILNSITDGARSTMAWYDNLSPAARYVVNTGVSTGVNALTGANAQRAASEAADAQQRQAEEDRARRGQVQPFGPGTFTPKAGILSSRAGKP